MADTTFTTVLSDVSETIKAEAGDAVLAAHEACIAYADFDESEAESALSVLEDAVGEFNAVAERLL